MAKYTVKYCCGHGTKEVELYGKQSEREHKIEWMEKNMLCPICYRAKQQAENEAKGLQLFIDIMPLEESNPVLLHYEGNTKPYKKEIHNLHYRWTEIPTIGLFGIFDTSKAQLTWCKKICIDEIDAEIQAAKNIGAQIINRISKVDMATFVTLERERTERKTKIEAQLAKLSKPVCPEFLENVYWNYKVYGKKGNYSYYNNGTKVALTDNQAIQALKYATAKEEYIKAVAEIRSQK